MEILKQVQDDNMMGIKFYYMLFERGLVGSLSIEEERASMKEQFILDRLGGVEGQDSTIDKQKQINQNI